MIFMYASLIFMNDTLIKVDTEQLKNMQYFVKLMGLLLVETQALSVDGLAAPSIHEQQHCRSFRWPWCDAVYARATALSFM